MFNLYVVDIGDANMRAGVASNGKVKLVSEVKTPREEEGISGEHALVDAMRELLRSLLSELPARRADGLAVSASGIMTLREKQRARSYGPFQNKELYVLAPNIDGLKYVPLVSKLEVLCSEVFGRSLKVHVENDCNAALFSDVSQDNAICVDIGAGIGASIKEDGNVMHLKGTWSCMEIGHGAKANFKGEYLRRCRCGVIGCLEAVIGGWAMKERYDVAPESASPDIYTVMREDVVRFLSPAVSKLVNQTSISNVLLTGQGSIGYAKDSEFLSEIKHSIEKEYLSEFEESVIVNVELLQMSPLAELIGVSNAWKQYIP